MVPTSRALMSAFLFNYVIKPVIGLVFIFMFYFMFSNYELRVYSTNDNEPNMNDLYLTTFALFLYAVGVSMVFF